MNPNLNQMAGHLKFLGYSIEKIEPAAEGEKYLVIAKHSNRNNIVFFELAPSIIMFRVNLTTERNPSDEMDAFVNKANRGFGITRMYYDIVDGKATLRLEAIYSSDYKKENFGLFIDLFISDQQSLYRFDDFAKVFLEESVPSTTQP